MSDTISFIKFTRKGAIGNNEGKNSDVFLATDDQLGCDLVIKRVKKKNLYPKNTLQKQK